MIEIASQLVRIMNIDGKRIRQQRKQRAWSQEHLAHVSGLGLRTVQRIEATGTGSAESALALASAFEMPVHTLALKSQTMARLQRFKRSAAAISLLAGSFVALLLARGVTAEQIELAIGFSEDGETLKERSILAEEGHDSSLSLNQSVHAIVKPENIEIGGQEILAISFRIYEEAVDGESSLIGSPELLFEEGANWVLEIDNAPSGKVYRFVVQAQHISG